MRILINDFGGYPFPVQLSRYLAANGYNVVHTYVSNIKTPHGDMDSGGKSPNLKIWPIELDTEFKKYSFVGRFKGEYEFAKKLSLVIDSFNPDILVSANTPLLAQSVLLDKCRKLSIKFIYWCQDIHSIAIENYLKKRLSFPGKLIGVYFKKIEIRLLEQSNYVVNITNGFNDIFKSWGISQKNMSVIYNWGPVNELPVESKTNEWSKQIGVSDKQVIIYSGTLGLKHNPMLIAEAVKNFKENEDVVFLVISEGIGAEILKEQKTTFDLNNLLILPYQDYRMLPKVLASADILLSILEKDAALFSVPSKVLSYLCAQKPIILSVPTDNLSARIVSETNSGFCIEPNDAEGLIEKIKILLDNDELRKNMGLNGRKYAEENFEIAAIAKKFIKIFQTIAE